MPTLVKLSVDDAPLDPDGYEFEIVQDNFDALNFV